MKESNRRILRFVLQMVAAAISAAITALGTTSCMSTVGVL